MHAQILMSAKLEAINAIRTQPVRIMLDLIHVNVTAVTKVQVNIV